MTVRGFDKLARKLRARREKACIPLKVAAEMSGVSARRIELIEAADLRADMDAVVLYALWHGLFVQFRLIPEVK